MRCFRFARHENAWIVSSEHWDACMHTEEIIRAILKQRMDKTNEKAAGACLISSGSLSEVKDYA